MSFLGKISCRMAPRGPILSTFSATMSYTKPTVDSTRTVVESSIQLKLVTLPENLPGKCLDGTRPVFYVQKPKSKHEKISRKEKVLIFLEEGGFCHEPTVELNTEQFSCDKRKSEVKKSKPFLHVKNGILTSLTFKDPPKPEF